MGNDLDLRPGEWAQVLSLDEIILTLDEKGCSQGLIFMSELEQFCGKRFKVKKRVKGSCWRPQKNSASSDPGDNIGGSEL